MMLEKISTKHLEEDCFTPPKEIPDSLSNAVERIATKWPTDMNFYWHNCQHFSTFCVAEIDKLQ